MMDLWLAMFSDPKKDRFRPELNLSYGVMRGELTQKAANSTSTAVSSSGAQGRAQLWLTNLISGTAGIRTLNIDFGIEGYGRSLTASTSEASAQAATDVSDPGATATTSAASTQTTASVASQLRHSYGAAALRLFGNHIQDSSLVVKYGQYQSETVPDGLSSDANASTLVSNKIKGVVAGADLQIYVLRFLGLSGSYLSYGDASGASGSLGQNGSYADAMGFVEVSLLRLEAGRYQESWQRGTGDAALESHESGMLAGAKLLF